MPNPVLVLELCPFRCHPRLQFGSVRVAHTFSPASTGHSGPPPSLLAAPPLAAVASRIRRASPPRAARASCAFVATARASPSSRMRVVVARRRLARHSMATLDGDASLAPRSRGRALDRPWHKTYLDRRARASKAQKRALRELYGAHGVAFDAREARRAREGRGDAGSDDGASRRARETDAALWTTLDCDALCGAGGAGRGRALEVGFGMGDNLLSSAAAFDDHVFVGCEVHRPGVAQALMGIEARGLGDRVKVSRADGLWVLDAYATARSLDEVACHFPDPWRGESKAHRRLVNPLLFVLLERALRPGGRLSVATDDAEYAEHVRRVFRDFAQPRGWARCDAFARFDSKYSLKASEEGRECVDFGFRFPGSIDVA